MQNNSARNYVTGQPDLFSAENMTLSTEAHLKRDRSGSNGYSFGFPVPAYNEVQGNNWIRSCIQDETIDSNFSQLNQAAHEMDQPHEQDMEIGYEESPPPPTYEGLEQRFIAEIMKLARERSNEEDAEFARHKERILEIKAEYQERLSALRAQQATRREEFLRKDLQARLNQYHAGKRNQFPTIKVPDVHGYRGPLTAGEAIGRFNGVTEYKHDGEGMLSVPSGRSEGNEARVPLPPGYRGPLTAGEAIGRFNGVTEYKHDGEGTPLILSGGSEGSEARVPLPPGYRGPLTAGEAIGRVNGVTDYKHDGEGLPSIPSGRSEGSEARVPLPPGYRGPLTAGEAIGRFNGVTEYKHDGEGTLSIPCARSEGSEAKTRVPLPPGRVYNNRAVYD